LFPEKNILVITYWSLTDALIQTYTLPYLRIMLSVLPKGSKIHLITLERGIDLHNGKEIEEGIIITQFKLLPFGPKAILHWRKNLKSLREMCRVNRICKIHTWCTPAGGIGYLLSKRTGIPLVLDSYEPHADAMVETGTWKKYGPAFRTLQHLEKKQTFHAEWLIGVVPGMKEYASQKFGYKGSNFLTKPACINTDQFTVRKRKNQKLLAELGLKDKVVCIYAGKLGGLYLTEIAFDFFKTAAEFWGEKFHVLLLTSAEHELIDQYSRNAALNRNQISAVFVPHNEMPDYMGLGDLAFSAFKPVPSRKYCTPIKNGEYWAMGLPVVIPEGISTDSDIIRENNAGYVCRELSKAEFEKACKHIDQLFHSESEDKLSARIHQLAEKHRNFTVALEVYKTIYGN
jgi:glycosyltransferase involved in cell wall biosynthesis